MGDEMVATMAVQMGDEMVVMKDDAMVVKRAASTDSPMAV